MNRTSGYYLTFYASDSLIQKAHHFIDTISNAPDGRHGHHYISMASQLTEEVINIFLLDLINVVKLNASASKAIKVCANTGLKVSGALTKSIYKNASHEELHSVKDLWARQLLNFDGHAHCQCFGLPLENHLADGLLSYMHTNGPDPLDDIELTIARMNRLTDRIVSGFFVEPTHHVEMTFITKKALHVGIESVEKAIRHVLQSVLRKLDRPGVERFIQHYSRIIQPAPAHPHQPFLQTSRLEPLEEAI